MENRAILNNKDADQIVKMHRLICFFVNCIMQNKICLGRGSKPCTFTTLLICTLHRFVNQ